MQTERVTVQTADGAFNAYVARPDSPKAPAVIVLQEIFGVNAAMREITDGLAGQGYLAICPDLFWRIEPGIEIGEDQMPRAFELFGLFDVETGMKDIQATVDLIRADPQSTGKVGAVGFCLGGMLAYLTAARTDVDASVSYYGVNIHKRLDEAQTITHPILLHIAGEDGFVPKAAQDEIKAGLAGHPQVEIHTYPGRDHAFARPHGSSFHAADAQLAGERSLAFFKKHLA